ncbi:MAG: GTP-binding protein [Aliidongia sp.]
MSALSVTAAGSRLPVTVLTGFLGSGKTTILGALLRHPALARTAVIINELGEVGLDHELVRQGGAGEAILLPSGCICCTIRSDLADTLRDLFQKRVRGQGPDFDRVMIETTGLADPAPILHTLIADPITAARYVVDGVVTVIDAYNADWQLDTQREAVKQAALADRILLTKTDLADPTATARLVDRLRLINPATPIPVLHGAVDPALILGTGFTGGEQLDDWAAHEAAHDHAAHDHHDDGIRSFCLTFATPLEWDRVAGALDQLAELADGRLLRVKAILDIAGSDRPVVVHGIQHLFHPPAQLDGWAGPERTSRIVFITNGLERAPVEEIFRALSG